VTGFEEGVDEVTMPAVAFFSAEGPAEDLDDLEGVLDIEGALS
jgi:hypothetical protein